MTSTTNSFVLAPVLWLVRCPVVVYYCVGLATGLPELAFLLSLILCEDAYHRIASKASSIQSKMFSCVNLGALFIAFFASGAPRFDMALPTIIAFLMIGVTSKARRDKMQKASELNCKLFADSASCGSPLRIQAPKLIQSPQALSHASTEKTCVANGHSPDVQVRVVGQQKTIAPSGHRERAAAAVNVEKKALLVPTPYKDLHAEVQDILLSGCSNPSDDTIVRQLVAMVRKSVKSIIPEADVFGCAVGNLSYNAAKGLKPEVEIVATATPQVLTSRLTAYFLKGQHISNGTKKSKSLATLQPDKLQKTATRVLSERFTNLRYWRSQFTGPEPTAYLLAPPSLGICDYSIRISFTINCPYPVNLQQILSKSDKNSQELIVLVTRWAKVRGIANSAKCHLHPYAFGLLVMYFMRQREGELSEKTLVEVFEEFVQFYRTLFDRRDEAIDVCFTARGVAQAMAAHESARCGIPYIEDPFDSSNNLAANMSAESICRLREELARATEILAGGVNTLADMLQPWEFPRPPSSRVPAEQIPES